MIVKFKNLLLSGTAKDTFFIFAGNSASAGFGMLFTLLVAKALTVTEFGIFSAINNLIMITSSLSDVGTSSGGLKFISAAESKGNKKESFAFTKAAFMIRFAVSSAFSLLLVLFARQISPTLFKTDDYTVSFWASGINLTLFVWLFMPFVLRGRKKFLESAVVDSSVGVFRFVLILLFFILGTVTLGSSLFVFLAGCFLATILAFYYSGTEFLTVKVSKDIWKRLLSFSGWLGVNNVISAISGRLDVTMLAYLSTAAAVGYYSLASRFALFIVVLTGSFSAVLATRFASFEDKEKEKNYLLKTTLALVPVALGIVLWAAFAKPFLTLLFGDKYLDAVPIFQGLALTYIPFLFTAPPVSAIIYAMKKPSYIGYFSFYQLLLVFIANLIFIQKYGAMGPIIALLLLNVSLVIYTWGIVGKYYFVKIDNRD